MLQDQSELLQAADFEITRGGDCVSYSDKFNEALEKELKKKKKKEETSNNTKASVSSTKTDYASTFDSALEREIGDRYPIVRATSIYDDDIAPVKRLNTLAESALSDPDFRKYSDLGASVKNPTFEDATKGIGIAGWRPFADEIQNPVTYVRENEMEVRLLGDKPLDGIDFLWANMTDEEVEVYNYYLAKDGKDKAKKYLESLKGTLSEREGRKISNNINGNSVAEVIIGGIAGVESGMKGATVGMKNLVTGSKETMTPSPIQYADQILAEDNEGFLMAAHDTASAIGNMTPSIGVGMVAGPVAGAFVMGMGVAGNKYNAMIEEGYDVEEAQVTGVLNGVSEGLTQYLLGGIGKLGGKGASAVFSKIAPNAAGKITEMISNVAAKSPRILQAIGHASKEMGKEAAEEALQTYLEPLIDSWVTGEEFEAPDFEEVVYSALLGAVTSGILEGAPAVGKATVDTVTGKPKLTADEQTVSDRVAEYEIARREKAGETLTEKEKKKIAEAVQRDMDKGYIPTEAIEAVLGGESYKTYRDTVTREDALRQEYEELGGLEKPTLAQQTRYQELHNSRDTFINDDMRNDLRSKARDEVRKRVSGTRLEESYREIERKNEKFTADLDQYTDENSRKTVENIVKSGLLDNTNRSHEMVENLAKLSKDRKVTVELTNNEKLKAEGKVYTFKKDITADGNSAVFSVGMRNIDEDFKPVVTVNGQAVTDFKVDYANGEITLSSPVAADSVIHVEYQKVSAMNGSYDKGKRIIELNVDSEEAWQVTVGHEIKHSFEGTKYEKEFNKAITDYAKKIGVYDSIVEAVNGVYNDGAEIDSEVTAILTGEYIATDEEFVKYLSTNHRNIFQKIYDEIKHLLKMVTAGSDAARALERAKHIYSKMYRESVDTQTSTSENGSSQYDIAVMDNGNMHVRASRKVINGKTVEEQRKEITQFFSDLLQDNSSLDIQTVEGDVLTITKADTANKARDNYKQEHGNRIKMTDEDFAVKLRAEAHIDELAEVSTKKGGKPDGKNHDIAKDGFTYRRAYFEDFDGQYYEITLSIGHNGTVATVYNVRTKKEGVPPSAKIIAVVGSKPLGGTPSGGIISQNSEKSSSEVEISLSSDDVKVLDGGTAVKHSLSTWTPDTQEKVRKNLTKAGYEAERVDKWIDDLNGVASVIAADKDRLDFEAADNQVMLKNNQEYIKTLDASTLCAKRLQYQGTFNAIQHRLPNTVLTSDDLIELQNMLKEHGYEAPCSVCYVESRRRHLGKFAQEWLDGYSGEYKPNLDEVTTSDGLEKLRHSHPQTYKDFVDAMNAKGSANPKVVQLRTEYRNDIMSLTKKQVEKIEAIGGIRIQSFSDFETPHLLDMMQAVMDMSAKGLTSQAYTKVPNFAWVFGDTGIKINLSLIAEGNGFDSNGNLAFSSVEGMDINEAMAVRDAYSANVGTIIVGANDAHILACMADDRIDYIIPFHRSGWGKNEMDMMGLGSYEDYSYGQNEHDIETGKKVSNLYPPDYWDYNVSGKENAERYLKLCAQTGREPKFSNFLVNNGDGSYSLQPDGSTDGYWKTLIDFKMYDNEGNGAKQQKVQPNFNMEEAYRVLNEYEGGANSLPVANDVVEKFVAKYSNSNSLSGDEHPIKGGGAWRTPMNSLRYEAPVRDDIAPSPNTPTAQANTPTVQKDTPTEQKDTPTVPKSKRIADGSRSDELLNESLDNYPIETIEQKIAEKIRAIRGEIADKQDLRRESWENYENQISDLRARYNSKKNKDTKEASKILESISRIERLKASREAEFAKRISDLEARVEKMSDPTYVRAMYKQSVMESNAKWAADLVGDTSTWVDKKIGLQYATNTERRNLRDIVRDENGNVDIAKADAIDDALSGQYNRDEAEKKRELAKVRKKYADLKITKAEDAYIQMLGELRYNPDTTLTAQGVDEYYEQHKNKIDPAKVDEIIEIARQDYDDLLNRVNAELRKQGMKEIPYRQGYFPHFTEPKQNFIQKLLNWKVQDNEIPTSIAGLTETFKPTRSWQSFDKRRYSDETDYSFMKGFDSYSEGALDWIYHMDTLQKRRAVENHIRYTHSDEGISDRIKAVYASEDIDANEAQAQIEHILSEAKNPLNNFVQDFTTHTNILAGKKNSLDRTVEQWTNRHIYSVMTNVQNRMSANMVLANVRSALTNFIPITQSWAQVSPLRSLQAVKQTIANSIKDDGTVDKSTFLTNRLREVDKLYQTNWDKVLDKAGIMFEIVDNISSQVIWRSKYNQNLADGMTEAQAIRNADQFAENVMAGRSKGNEPTLFNAKNPFVKAFTMFQLEVNNQYGYLFKDVPNDLKAETEHWKFNLAKGYTAVFVGAYIYNALLEKVTGSDAALDPIGIVEELLRDLGLLGDDEEEEPEKIVTNLVGNVVEELPFVGGVLGGGRIPISSAIPYGGEYGGGVSGFAEDLGNIGDGGLKNIGKEMMNPILNVGLPVGGGQLKKSVQGLKMFSDDHPVTGSYTDSGKLRFPVEDTPLNRAQALVFGQYASKNAREYFDNDYAPLGEKQIQEYIDVDMPIKDYWEYREGLNDIAPLPGKSSVTLEQKLNYVDGLDLPTYKKNILVNNLSSRKDPIDMTSYGDYGSLDEFDFATKNPEKYAFAKSVGGYSAYQIYSDALYDIKSDKDENGKTINGSRKEKVLSYINNLDADYYTKILLWKSEYPSDDTYNREIIDYINGLSGLSYTDRVNALTELGFRVTADGQIYAD